MLSKPANNLKMASAESSDVFEADLTRLAESFAQIQAMVLIRPIDLDESSPEQLQIGSATMQLLIDGMSPVHKDIGDTLEEYRNVLKLWKQYISSIGEAEGISTEEAQYKKVTNDLNISTLFGSAQAKHRELGGILTEAKTKRQKADILLRRTPEATIPVAPTSAKHQLPTALEQHHINYRYLMGTF